MNNTILPSGRDSVADALRGFAIILIVYAHIIKWFDYSGITLKYSLVFSEWISSFHMPIMFMIAGYVHAISAGRASIKKAAVALYLPCLYFSLSQWLIMYFIFAEKNPANFGAAKLSDLFLIPLMGFKEYWFLAALFFVKSVHIVLEHKISRRFMHSFFWVALFIVLRVFRHSMPVVLPAAYFRLYVYMGIYFHAGYLMKQNNVFTSPKILHGLLLLCAGTICFCAEMFSRADIFTVTGAAFCISTGIFTIFYAMRVNNSVLQVYGRYSMVVYCLHNYAAASLRMLFTVSGLSSSASPIILAAIGIIFAMTAPLAVVWLYKNVKCLRWIEYIFYPGKMISG